MFQYSSTVQETAESIGVWYNLATDTKLVRKQCPEQLRNCADDLVV